jgi:hypothetical protein
VYIAGCSTAGITRTAPHPASNAVTNTPSALFECRRKKRPFGSDNIAFVNLDEASFICVNAARLVGAPQGEDRISVED